MNTAALQMERVQGEQLGVSNLQSPFSSLSACLGIYHLLTFEAYGVWFFSIICKFLCASVFFEQTGSKIWIVLLSAGIVWWLDTDSRAKCTAFDR